jgi:hypothetical protein
MPVSQPARIDAQPPKPHYAVVVLHLAKPEFMERPTVAPIRIWTESLESGLDSLRRFALPHLRCPSRFPAGGGCPGRSSLWDWPVAVSEVKPAACPWQDLPVRA